MPTLVRRRRVTFPTLVAAVLMMAASTTFTPLTPPAAAATADAPLTWAPPAGWRNFEEVVVPASGGVISLDPDKDYRISAPDVVRGAVDLRGGRNVVWIGGHISISNKAKYEPATNRRGLVIRDDLNRASHDGRIVHIEGLLFDGNDLSEGINVAAPSAIVQIQNVRVSAVILRGADDRDGTGGYDSLSHPDVLQPWGGYKELRVDGLTGYTSYQGLYLLQDIGSPTQGDIYFRRMNLEAIQVQGEDGYTYTGHRLMRWDPAKTGQVFMDRGTVWMRHHKESGWTAAGYDRHAYRDGNGRLVADPPPGNSRFEDNLYPAPAVKSDSLGKYAAWSQTLDDGRRAIRNWTDDGAGRVYRGRPPGGDYVPESMVGRGYRSPGYGVTGETQVRIIEANSDALVRQSAPHRNAGDATRLTAKTDPTVTSYVRFRVPSSVGDVSRAVVRVRVKSDERTRVVVRKAAAGAWNEGSITYANAPDLRRKLDATIVKTKGTWIDVDVTDLVDGPGTYTIAVVGRRSVAATFYSRESNAAPELLVMSN